MLCPRVTPSARLGIDQSVHSVLLLHTGESCCSTLWCLSCVILMFDHQDWVQASKIWCAKGWVPSNFLHMWPCVCCKTDIYTSSLWLAITHAGHHRHMQLLDLVSFCHIARLWCLLQYTLYTFVRFYCILKYTSAVYFLRPFCTSKVHTAMMRANI